MRLEEEKIDDIIDEGKHYEGKNNNLLITSREISVKVAEQLQPSMEGKAYKSMIKQLHFPMRKHMSVKKQI